RRRSLSLCVLRLFPFLSGSRHIELYSYFSYCVGASVCLCVRSEEKEGRPGGGPTDSTFAEAVESFHFSAIIFYAPKVLEVCKTGHTQLRCDRPRQGINAHNNLSSSISFIPSCAQRILEHEASCRRSKQCQAI
ncbi:unnamed protein product, partial [Pylaiella littoralis]